MSKTLGANQDEKFFLEFTTNVANRAFQMGAIATAIANDIDDCYPTDGQGLTKSVTPKWLKNLQVADNDGGQNMSKDYTVWKFDAPFLLKEWEYKKYGFVISSGATDPAVNTNFGSSDMCIVCFVDATYARGLDGKMYFDIQDHTTDEANVGQTETEVRLPVGVDNCVVIEGL